MMKPNRYGIGVLFTFLSIGSILKAHPGPGIVKDSKGNIFYTDLVQVWQIWPNGKKTIAVPGVHTHELFMDAYDVLYGEHLWFNGEKANTWGCYEWRLHPDGKLDTIFGPAPAFQNEYALNRDARGNQYYVQHAPVKKFFRINPDGSLKKLAEGQFNSIRFTFVTREGNWYFTSENNLYLLDTLGRISMRVKDIGSATLSHPGNFKDPYVVGIWEDPRHNVYVADYSGQKVKRVDTEGKVDVIAHSKSPWSPVGGLIDDQGNLWLLENDIINRVQVRKINKADFNSSHFKAPVWNNAMPMVLWTAILTSLYLLYLKYKSFRLQK